VSSARRSRRQAEVDLPTSTSQVALSHDHILGDEDDHDDCDGDDGDDDNDGDDGEDDGDNVDNDHGDEVTVTASAPLAIEDLMPLRLAVLFI